MRLQNEYFSLLLSSDNLELYLDNIKHLDHLDNLEILEKLKEFLFSKGIKKHLSDSAVIETLEFFQSDKNFRSINLFNLSKPVMTWNWGDSLSDLKQAKDWITDLERSSRYWLKASCHQDKSIFYFGLGEKVASISKVPEYDCFGELLNVWRPEKWFELGDGLKIVDKGTHYDLESTKCGYLFVIKGQLLLQGIEIISADEMEKSALILPPSNNSDIWRSDLKNILESHGKNIEDLDNIQTCSLERGIDPCEATAPELKRFIPAKGHWYEQVDEGDVCAMIMPGQKAKDGQTVTGKSFSAKSSNNEIPQLNTGEGIELFKDELGRDLYRSKKRGVAVYRKGVLSVHENLVIEGDLSPNYGLIRYEGKVVIKGDVLSGAFIECDELEVVGSVENQVNIICNGHVLVRGGLWGEETKVKTNSIVVRHVQASEVYAKENIVIRSYAYGAQLFSFGAIQILGEGLEDNHTSLIGGVCNSFNNIVVHSVGSNMNASFVCAGLNFKLWKDCEEAKLLARKLNKEIVDLQNKIPSELMLEEGLDSLSDSLRDEVILLLKDIKEKMAKRQKILSYVQNNQKNCINVNREDVFIEVKNVLEPDTTIMLKEKEVFEKKSLKGNFLYRENASSQEIVRSVTDSDKISA